MSTYWDHKIVVICLVYLILYHRYTKFPIKHEIFPTLTLTPTDRIISLSVVSCERNRAFVGILQYVVDGMNHETEGLLSLSQTPHTMYILILVA